MPYGARALTGVVGFPVRHSRSPAMQRAAFEAAGLDWRYLALPVPPGLLAETVRALAGSGYRGVNVTLPHKIAALSLADDPSEAASAIGAANTLTFDDGRIAAENTDAPGLIAALDDPVRGSRALVLGAGGAARAAAWALREAGASEVAIWNRTTERAEALARELDLRAVAAPKPADVLVNATTIGLDASLDERAALEALGLAASQPPATVVDLVYAGGTTPVCAWAARGGARVVDGVEVLVRQGALSFELWTGRAAPIQAMREAAQAPASGSTGAP